MRAELLAHTVVPPGSRITPLRGTGWVAQTDEQRLLVFDHALETLVVFPLPTNWPRGAHAVSPDLSFAAVSDYDRIALVDARGTVFREIGHVPWGAGGQRIRVLSRHGRRPRVGHRGQP